MYPKNSLPPHDLDTRLDGSCYKSIDVRKVAQEAQIQLMIEALESTLEDIDLQLKAQVIEPPSRVSD